MSNKWSTALWVIGALSVLGAPGLSQAELVIDLPEIAGLYEDAVVSGEIVIPGTVGYPDISLVVSGSLTPGTYSRCSEPDVLHVEGSEVHLFIYLGGTLWTIASVYTGEVDGPFVAEGVFVSTHELPFPLSALSGEFEYEAYIGWSPLGPLVVCYIPRVAPVINIESVQIVSEEAVSSVRSNWGAVKALFR